MMNTEQSKYKRIRAIVIADDDDRVGQLADTTADLLLSLGDISDITIEKAFAQYHCSKSFGIKGNHDADRPFPSFVTPLHYSVETYGGISFGGFNGCWKYKPRGAYLFEQEEVSRLLRVFPKVDVFVAHNSPSGIHERDSDVHQGFRGFKEYIDRTRPKYFIHGHQHLNQLTSIGETQVIGVFGETVLEV